jgi:hypothetical protein
MYILFLPILIRVVKQANNHRQGSSLQPAILKCVRSSLMAAKRAATRRLDQVKKEMCKRE